MLEDCTFDQALLAESKLNSYIKVLIEDIAQYSHKEARNDKAFLLSLYRLYLCGEGGSFNPEFRSYSKYGEKILFYDLCQKYFGYCRKYVERCIKIVDRFIVWDVDDPIENAKYKYPILDNYTISKIIEILFVPDVEFQEAIDSEKIRSNSTQAELRLWVQSRKVATPKTESILLKEEKQSEISDAEEKPTLSSYSVERWYDRDYFKKLGKKDLVEIIWRLQSKYVPYK